MVILDFYVIDVFLLGWGRLFMYEIGGGVGCGVEIVEVERVYVGVKVGGCM
jgi:hypothetical protein